MSIKRTLSALSLIALLGLPALSPARAMPQVATYVVNANTAAADAHPGDGVCATTGGTCTLHAAIQEANLDGVPSTITFASRFQGTHDIDGCGLPTLTEPETTLDASNWWDTADNRPGVEIVGLACTLLTIGADNTTVYGLMFGGGSSTGVRITSGAFNTIGGYEQGQRNAFLVGEMGVWIQSSGILNQVINNTIGTVDGETMPVGGMGKMGVYVYGGQSYSVISDNVIVGQSEAGIRLAAHNNVVTNNIIGLDAWQQKSLPNALGVEVAWGNDNVIGPNNVIAGNTGHGIFLYHADNNLVHANTIGYAGGGGLANGDAGINIYGSVDNQIIDGNVIGPNDGYGLTVESSSGTIIQGNTIHDNDFGGVYVKADHTQIGGTGDDQQNSINGNGGSGIIIDAASYVSVVNNIIGLDQGAFDNGNAGHGILIVNGAKHNVIGGAAGSEGNRIGWNHMDGIHLIGSGTEDNYVMGNLIGIAAPGVAGTWEAPNGNHGIGIYDGASGTYVGWPGPPSYANTIMASGWSGVAIVNGSDNNYVLENNIGTDGAGLNWGNAYYGVAVVNSAGTAIKENHIAYNGTHGGADGVEAGVQINGSTATDNMITGNSIHDNDGPGIRLDNGGNGDLAAPILDSADCGSLQGHTSPPCVNCMIEIYSDGGEEGRVFEGYFTTPASGDIIWSGTLNGPNVTAIAILNGATQNTSPFSAPIHVGACNAPPTAAFTVAPPEGPLSTIFHFDASGCSDSTDPASALQVRWDWENDGAYDTAWSPTKTADHTYPAPGTHTARLAVMDTWGLTGVATHTVVVNEEFTVYLPHVVNE